MTGPKATLINNNQKIGAGCPMKGYTKIIILAEKENPGPHRRPGSTN